MKGKYILKRNGQEYECELLRKCILSTGPVVYLIKRDVKSPYSNPYVVGVRRDDETLEFMSFAKMQRAMSYYLDMICCYA